MEKTSGVEGIKRLLKQELIHEFDNPNDKRIRIVAGTQNGKTALADLLPRMGLAGSMAVGNLTSADVGTLSFLLNKLDYHHNEIFMNHRALSLEDLSQRFDVNKKNR